jgi:hypothetical protein
VARVPFASRKSERMVQTTGVKYTLSINNGIRFADTCQIPQRKLRVGVSVTLKVALLKNVEAEKNLRKN